MPDTARLPELVYVALGSNLGERERHLARARTALAALPNTTVVAATDVEETAPLGPPDQGPYLNQMLALRTTLDPMTLLRHLHGIERAEGRVRRERWGARTLDLDIVRFGDRHIADPALTVPHPEVPHRDFWQREIAELTTLLTLGSPRRDR